MTIGHLYDYIRSRWATTTTKMLCQSPSSNRCRKWRIEMIAWLLTYWSGRMLGWRMGYLFIYRHKKFEKKYLCVSFFTPLIFCMYIQCCFWSFIFKLPKASENVFHFELWQLFTKCTYIVVYKVVVFFLYNY